MARERIRVRRMGARLVKVAHLIAVDLPGFGRSERNDALMRRRAMGEFMVRVADAFHLEKPQVVATAIGTSASLFAAASHSDRFLSLVVGAGGGPFRLSSEIPCANGVFAQDLEPYRRI